MFLRQDLGLSLLDLETSLNDRASGSDVRRVSPDDVAFHFDATDPTITFGEAEVPVTETGLQAIADFLTIPSAFTKRLVANTQGETQNAVFTDILRNTVRKDLRVIHGTGGLITIGEWGRDPVRPVALVRAAANAMGTDRAHIARLVDESHEFSFDAYVPTDHDRGVGGDRQVDDITAGGLRFGVNLKQGLAPWVQPFMYRLACTNGYESSREGLKVDARGQTVDEVIAEIEQMAQIAFAGVERDIEHFYSLRDVKVDNPERALRAIARERGLPDRSTMALMDLAAGEDLPDDPSMFDITNLITNLANSPQIRNDGGRLLLERAGGAVISDHAARCGHCLQRVHDN